MQRRERIIRDARSRRRRGAARAAECRQVDADPRGLGGAPARRRLSVHDAASEPRRGLLRRAAQLRDGRHSRADRRRGGGCRARAPVPQALQRTGVLLHLVDMAPSDPDADPVRDARAIVAELKKFSKEPGRQAALAGHQQARPAAGRGGRGARAARSCGGCATGSGAPDFGGHRSRHARAGRGGHEFPRGRGSAKRRARAGGPMRNSKVRQRIAAGKLKLRIRDLRNLGVEVRADAGGDRHPHRRRAAPPGRGAHLRRAQARRARRRR